MIANLIAEGAQLVNTSGAGPVSARSTASAHASAKDRIKAFTLEFDEAIRTQSACSVPDLELRSQLKEKVKELISVPYIYFYNQ